MQSVFDLKSGPYEPHIDLQIAAYWELIRNGKAEGLVFDEATHTGKVNGESLLSVTTILRKARMTPEFYNFIDPWYLARGTYVHLATELYDRGRLDEDTVDPEITPYLDAYKVFRGDFGARITGIETRLYHPVYKYFGIASIGDKSRGPSVTSLHSETGKGTSPVQAYRSREHPRSLQRVRECAERDEVERTKYQGGVTWNEIG